MVHSLVKAYGLLSPHSSTNTQLRMLPPSPAGINDLAVYHTRDYLEFVLNSKTTVKPTYTSRAEFGLEEVQLDGIICDSTFRLNDV